MKLLAYGEDGLTLWALTRRLDELLRALQDPSDSSECVVLFRPSFGRRGGEDGPQFGEFDFIVLTEKAILLGESKWDSSSEEVRDGALILRPEQRSRHKIMHFYINRFAFGSYETWDEFIAAETSRFSEMGLGKALAPKGSRLAKNLNEVLRKIRGRFHSPPPITDVLLYLYRKDEQISLPSKGPEGFHLVLLDYSADSEGNMISIVM